MLVLVVLVLVVEPDNEEEEEDSQHRRLLVRCRNKERPVQLAATAAGVSFAVHIITSEQLDDHTVQLYVVMLGGGDGPTVSPMILVESRIGIFKLKIPIRD